MGKRLERLRVDYSAVLNMELLQKQDPTKAKIPIHSPHTFLLLFQLALAFHGQTSRKSTFSAIISSLPTHSAPSHPGSHYRHCNKTVLIKSPVPSMRLQLVARLLFHLT